MDTRSYIPGLALGSSIAIVSISMLNAMSAAISFALGCLLLVIALTDARHLIIPDQLSLPEIPAGLIAVYFLTNSPEPHLVLLQHVMAVIAWQRPSLDKSCHENSWTASGLGCVKTPNISFCIKTICTRT